VEPINRIEQAYRTLTSQGREVLKLFSGNPNEQGFHFPKEILDAVYRRYFERQEYHPHPKGLPAARQAISEYYARQAASVDPEDIVLTSGTSESFFYLFSLLAKPGDNILTPNPAYPLFDHIADLARVELRHYQLKEENRWSIDYEDLRRKTDDRTKAILLISPNNPTGAVHSEEEIEQVVDWANRKEIPLICDEVFSEFYFGEGKFPRPMTVAKPRLCFTLNGISKMFALPALKLGWIAVTGEKSLVDPFVDRLETTADTFLSCHIPIQEALPDLFSKGQDFLKSYREEVGRRRGLAIKILRQSPTIHFVEPVGGFYLMASVDTKLSEEDFVIRLMQEKNIFVHPGYFYDYEKGIHVVVSFLLKEKSLERAVLSLVDFVSR
jgi:aspartate/methionine/tyrosine aminotransferase